MQTADSFLTDPQWLLLQPLLAPSASRGRPPLEKRLILENIFWKLTSNQPWYDIPSESPSWQTTYQHYHRWKHTGLWKSIIFTLMADLHTRGGFDLLQAHTSHMLTFTRDCTGEFSFDYPPALEGTWQLSTAFLLLILLASDL